MWWKHVAPAEEMRAMWPQEQNGSADLVVMDESDPREEWEGWQFKTGRKHPRCYGLEVHLSKNAGKVDGKPTTRPYAVGDFETLCVVNVYDTHIDRWAIPATELEKRGYLTSDTTPGVTGLFVHLPEALTDERPGYDRNGQKNRPNTSIWTRRFHARYEI